MKASREILSPNIWTKPVSIIWGLKDRWLDFNGVEAFAKSVNARLVQLSEVTLVSLIGFMHAILISNLTM